MLLPPLLAIFVPVATGLFLGVGGVLGLLIGGLSSGFVLAIFMANSGGTWDNAKNMWKKVISEVKALITIKLQLLAIPLVTHSKTLPSIIKHSHQTDVDGQHCYGRFNCILQLILINKKA